jgi:dihydrofolate reductase
MSENRIIVWMQTSLDGRTAGPEGEFDWPVIGPDLHRHFVETLGNAGLFLYGRKIFEMMASFWPIADELPDASEMQAAYARIWRPMPKLVVSRTLADVDWNGDVVDSVDERITEAKRAADGDVYAFGGAETVAELSRQDLVDEYRLFVHPVVLGGGPTLFPHLVDRQQMSLVGARTFDDHVVALRYARVR